MSLEALPEAEPAATRPLTRLQKGLAAICSLLLLVMMMVTVADVIGRYLFNSPLSGGTEITALLLSSVIFIGLTGVCLDDEHVTVDLILDHLPGFVQPVRQVLIRLVSSAMLGVIAWRILVHGQGMGAYGERTVSLHIPVAPIAYLCAGFTAIAAIITFGSIFAHLRAR